VRSCRGASCTSRSRHSEYLIAALEVLPSLGPVDRMFGMPRMRRLVISILVALSILYAALEGFGIALLLPVLQHAENGPEVVHRPTRA